MSSYLGDIEVISHFSVERWHFLRRRSPSRLALLEGSHGHPCRKTCLVSIYLIDESIQKIRESFGSALKLLQESTLRQTWPEEDQRSSFDVKGETSVLGSRLGSSEGWTLTGRYTNSTSRDNGVYWSADTTSLASQTSPTKDAGSMIRSHGTELVATRHAACVGSGRGRLGGARHIDTGRQGGGCKRGRRGPTAIIFAGCRRRRSMGNYWGRNSKNFVSFVVFLRIKPYLLGNIVLLTLPAIECENPPVVVMLQNRRAAGTASSSKSALGFLSPLGGNRSRSGSDNDGRHALSRSGRSFARRALLAMLRAGHRTILIAS